MKDYGKTMSSTEKVSRSAQNKTAKLYKDLSTRRARRVFVCSENFATIDDVNTTFSGTMDARFEPFHMVSGISLVFAHFEKNTPQTFMCIDNISTFVEFPLRDQGGRNSLSPVKNAFAFYGGDSTSTNAGNPMHKFESTMWFPTPISKLDRLVISIRDLNNDVVSHTVSTGSSLNFYAFTFDIFCDA